MGRAGLGGLQFFDCFAPHLVERGDGGEEGAFRVQSQFAQFVGGIAEAPELFAQRFQSHAAVLRRVAAARANRLVRLVGLFFERPDGAQRVRLAGFYGDVHALPG